MIEINLEFKFFYPLYLDITVNFFIFVIYLLSKIYVKYLKYRRVAHWILQLHSNTWFFILFFTLDFISLDPYMNLVPIINETEQYY